MSDGSDDGELGFVVAVRARLTELEAISRAVRRELELDLPPSASLLRDWEPGQWKSAPLHPNELSAIESALAAPLPAGLRELVLHEANGMIGPGHGLRPLDMKTVLGVSQRLRRRWSITGPLFPERTSGYHRAIRKAGDGALVIAELGRAMVYVLIVSGEARGSIWYDDSANSGIVAPVLVDDGGHVIDVSHLDLSRGDEVLGHFEDLARGARRARFEDWYLSWLDKLIAATRSATG